MRLLIFEDKVERGETSKNNMTPERKMTIIGKGIS